MKFLIFASTCIIFFAAFVFAQTPQTIQNNFSVEREFGGAQRHVYEVNLAKGQFLNFTVEQRGADVVLKIYTADGKFYDRLDSPNAAQGEEPFRMVSLDGGRFRIELSPWSENLPAGKYFIKPVEIRKATDAEIKAQKLKEELMKIVAEDRPFDRYPDALRRFYADRASLINPLGYVLSAAELVELTTKNPLQLPEGAASEVELSDARLEEFGDTAIMSLRWSRRLRNPKAKLDQTAVHRVGYVFKRLNGEWRVVSMQRTLMERDRNPVKLEAKQLDALVGVYEGDIPANTLAVTRENNLLYGKFPEGEKFELIPESENAFYAGFISVAFIRDANGAVTQAVVNYSPPEDRMTIQKKIK